MSLTDPATANDRRRGHEIPDNRRAGQHHFCTRLLTRSALSQADSEDRQLIERRSGRHRQYGIATQDTFEEQAGPLRELRDVDSCGARAEP